MLKVRIYLAAASELSTDRKEIELLVNRENKALTKRNVFLELIVWEDFVDSMSRTRLQDEYLTAIERSDIFILLVYQKVGKYIVEEFQTAHNQFNDTGKPIVLTYFKADSTNLNDYSHSETIDLSRFQEMLASLGHFSSSYKNIESLKHQFTLTLNKFIDSNWDDFLSKIEIQERDTSTKKETIFISYSHRDTAYLERIMVHLKPLQKSGHIDFWVDTKLTPGQKWKSEIENALNKAKVAILLVSADFLASDFIINYELLPLLDAAEGKGTQIIPVVLKPSRYLREQKLSIYQSINAPDKPLMGLSEFEREQCYDKIAEWVETNFPYTS